MTEQNVEQIIKAMTRAPDPACEVISIERAAAETILRHLEGASVLPEHVAFLRSQLAEPKVELWAVHSVGPGEIYPSLSKEHAEREAQELVELGRKMKAERVERGESVEHWHDWVINVIPSPWEPAEHFQILAEETIEHRDSLLVSIDEPASPWIKCTDRLPENDGPFWCWFGLEEPSCIQQRVCIFIHRQGVFADGSVTHWMPLPAAPAQPVDGVKSDE